MLWGVLAALPLCYGLLWLWMKSRRGVCVSTADMTGKTVIITGANQGIGYHTALDIASRNARVILACRNADRGRQAASAITTETGNPRVVAMALDLASKKSIERFALEVREKEPRLDVLIHNAGITGLTEKHMTDDGLELMFATNYFGPVYLTHLLTDLLKRSSPSRVVLVSSIAHKFTFSLDLQNLCAEKSYRPDGIYYCSKLALIMYGRKLSQQLKGSGVTVNSLHPGSVRTNLLNNLPLPIRCITTVISALFFRPVEEGCQTSIHCAVAEDLESVTGEYFSECRIAAPSTLATDKQLTEALWEKTQGILGVEL